MSLPVSVIILTKNEEADLPDCLNSLSWCNDIHLVDSGSNDLTVEIAQQRGVYIYSNEFHGFGAQRNWALDNCDTKYPWILFLDADERTTEEFVNALGYEIALASEQIAGFYCCWKTMIDDRWLKRCDSYPKWQFRLLRRGMARFENFGHGQREIEVKGDIGYVRKPYLHYAFSKGWAHWWERHTRYASEEAMLRLNKKVSFRELFSTHSAIRLKSLRVLATKTPGWPFIRFFMLYVLKLGFLEGQEGLRYCTNMAYYEYMIKIKMRELRTQRTSAHNRL